MKAVYVSFSRRTLIIFALIAAVTGCATKTQMHGVKPAEVSLGGIRTLAIVKFKGHHGESVRSSLYSKLSDSNHFSLIDTTQVNDIDQVIFDQIDDPRFLPELNALHADGIITGQVNVVIRDTPGKEDVEMEEGTGKYKEGRNLFNQKVQIEITRKVIKPVKYIIRRASITTDFKVFDLKTRKILATEKVTREFNQKYGGKNEVGYSAYKLADLPTKNQTIQQLADEISRKFAEKISPTRFTISVAFANDKENPMVKKGIDYAKGGAMEMAKEVWEEVVKSSPNNAAALYNIGVVYESYGDLASLNKAYTHYRRAAKFGDKDLYIKAVGRISTRIKQRQKLNKQKQMLQDTPETNSQGTGGIRIY